MCLGPHIQYFLQQHSSITIDPVPPQLPSRVYLPLLLLPKRQDLHRCVVFHSGWPPLPSICNGFILSFDIFYQSPPIWLATCAFVLRNRTTKVSIVIRQFKIGARRRLQDWISYSLGISRHRRISIWLTMLILSDSGAMITGFSYMRTVPMILWLTISTSVQINSTMVGCSLFEWYINYGDHACMPFDSSDWLARTWNIIHRLNNLASQLS